MWSGGWSDRRSRLRKKPSWQCFSFEQLVEHMDVCLLSWYAWEMLEAAPGLWYLSPRRRHTGIGCDQAERQARWLSNRER